MKSRNLLILLLACCTLDACNDKFGVNEVAYRHDNDECFYQYEYDYTVNNDYPIGYYEAVDEKTGLLVCFSRKCVYGKWVYPFENDPSGIYNNLCIGEDYGSCQFADITRGEDGVFRNDKGMLVPDMFDKKSETVNYMAACGECFSGTTECVDEVDQVPAEAPYRSVGKMRTCVNGLWTPYHYADNWASCKSSTELGSCNNNEIVTYSEQQGICHYGKCEKGVFYESEVCPTGASCVKENNIYSACGECKNDSEFCRLAESGVSSEVKCVNGSWDSGTLCTVFVNGVEQNVSCNGTAICGECRDGDGKYIVENNACVYKICKSGKWVNGKDPDRDVPCGNSCTSSEPLNDNGSSVPLDVRGYELLYQCGECINGSTRCIENDSETYVDVCINGQWEKNYSCPTFEYKTISCNADKTDCSECHQGSVKYVETDVDQSGVDHCYLSVCQMDATKGAYQWSPLSSCDFLKDVSCVLETSANPGENRVFSECGNCLNGDETCYSENNSRRGVVNRCINGAFVPVSKCGTEVNNTSCNEHDQPHCGECLNGDIRYLDDDQARCYKEICVGGNWVLDDKYENSSGDSCTIKQGQLTDGGECNNLTTPVRCVGVDQKKWNDPVEGILQTCKNGVFVDVMSCMEDAETPISCVSESSCGKCKDGAHRYADDENNACQLYICTDGVWVRDTDDKDNLACSSASVSCHSERSDKDIAKVDVSCGECMNGVHCLNDSNGGGSIQVCLNGQWDAYSRPCDSGFSCDSVKDECGSCLNGSSMMVNDSDGLCISYLCKDGNWVKGDDQACTNSCKLADGINVCGSCMNGTESCVNDDSNQGSYTFCAGGLNETRQCRASCAGNECGVCYDDETIFRNNDAGLCAKYKCVEGMWQEEQTFQFSCNTRNQGVCTLRESECPDCNKTEDYCVGTCVNGSMTCKDDGRNAIRCIEGLEQEIACSKCENSVCDMTCDREGETSCQDYGRMGYQRVCTDAQISESLCPGGYSCAGKFCGECVNGDRKFDEGTDQKCYEYVCDRGRWRQRTACENGFSCKVSNGVKSCNDANGCLNYTFDQTNAVGGGPWIAPTFLTLLTCYGGVKHENLCAATSSSRGNGVRTRGTFMTCTSPELDQLECYNEEDGLGRYSSRYHDDSSHVECEGNYSCHVLGNAASECGVCRNGATRCNSDLSGTVFQTCVNGAWGFDRPCNGRCVPGGPAAGCEDDR